MKNDKQKLAYRWILNIDGFNNFLLVKISRPKLHFDETGPHIKPIKITVFDDYDGLNAKAVMAWSHAWETEKAIEIKMLGSSGEVLETWKYTGVKLHKVKFSTLNYTKNKPCKIKIAVTYKDVILE